MEMKTALGMDIGGSHVTAALVDLERRAVIEASRAHRAVDPNASAEELLAAWAGAGLDAVRGMAGRVLVLHAGVGMPGPFEYAAGISRLTHKFAALYGMNVGAALQERWARGAPSAMDCMPVFFANDAAVWALGEAWAAKPVGLGAARVIGITLGTGLGSGFIENGRIIAQGDAVPPGGEIWNTPFRGGIAEDYAAGRVIVQLYREKCGLELSAERIAGRALSGDEQARAAFETLGANLAEIMAPWVARFEPDCLVVGGSIAHAWDLFHPALEAGLPGLDCRVTTRFEASSLLGGAVLGL